MAEGLWLWSAIHCNVVSVELQFIYQEVVHLGTGQHIHALLASRYMAPRYVVSHKNAAVDDVLLAGNKGVSSEGAT